MNYLTIMLPTPEGDYFAAHPEIDCFAYGGTKAEAVSNLAEVRAMVLAHRREHGLPTPKPLGLFDAPIDFSRFAEGVEVEYE